MAEVKSVMHADGVSAKLTCCSVLPHPTTQQSRCSRSQRLSCRSISYHANGYPMPTAELAEGLEAPVQLLYLATLLGFLAVGAYLVVRQVGIDLELRFLS